MSDSLRPHGLQHTRPPCPSPTPRVYSCPLSQWFHPVISASVIPFFSYHQSFPASGSFGMSQFFTSDGQSIGVSASASVLPMNTQDWSPLGGTGLDPLAVQGTLKSLLQHDNSKASILKCSAFFIVQLSHPSMTTGKTIALTRWTFVDKVMSLLFNMPTRMAKIQNTDNIKYWHGHGATGTLIHWWWKCNIIESPLKDSLLVSYKTKHGLTIQPSNHASWYLPKEAENLCSHKNLHMGIYSSFIHKCQNFEATKMFFSRWIGKYSEVPTRQGNIQRYKEMNY